MTRTRPCWPALLLGVALAAGAAAGAHAGEASLTLQRDEGALVLELRGSGEEFFGASRAGAAGPDAELVARGTTLLRDAGSAFHLSPAAACRVVETALGGRLLEAQGLAGVDRPEDRLLALRERDRRLDGMPARQDPPAASAGLAGNEDVVARYRFECARPAALQRITVLLFMSLPALERLQLSLPGDDTPPRSLHAGAPSFDLPPG